ncbi:LAME_0E03400g1_1 [Lachancea meyersii CBS 8951]|uniref:DASH complex subunit SPC19 n=1 Tax=Lachancea meyersii CBS 8951 TaxID=1266667 RepID=A0A1G4JGF2_9SACH|nr:LAME_0E03400g1_1 [Lachancea meyersii CBS 8951]
MADSLSQCVDSLQSSLQCLEKTVSKLNNESKTSNYLTKSLLQSRRVFELVPEYDVQRAKLDLIEEIEPLVNNLSGKVSKNLSRLERERDNLQQTLELNVLRLKNRFSGEDLFDEDAGSDVVFMTSSTAEELDQLKELKAQKSQLLERIRALEKNT